MNLISLFTLSFIALSILPSTENDVQGTGFVEVTVVEEGKVDLLPCRAWIEINNSRYYRPESANCVPYVRDMSFTSNGKFKIKVPVGNAIVHVERGKEYLPVNKEVDVKGDKVNEVRIYLKRWIDMAALGWYSMDIHCHFGADSLDILKQQSLADDINYQPVLTVWNSRQYKTKDIWDNQQVNPTIFADPSHLIAFNNQEIERIGGADFESIGALHLIGLKKPLDNPQTYAYPADVSLAEIARKTSPECIIDCDKPVWGENAVTAALGYFDSAQLCHNHYHRFSDLDPCCGMAVLRRSKSEKSRWGGLFWQTNQAYYSFLNCGIKLAATGGSAMGVMRVPLGYNRTYMKIEGELAQENILKAIKNGRTFATSGPMLFFEVNNQPSGATLNIDSKRPKSIQIKAGLQSIEPVVALEIIQNGKIIKSLNLEGQIPSPVLEKEIQMAVVPQESGWLAARAIYFNYNRFVRQAHSSPVYVIVDNKPIAFKKDALILRDWVDKLIQINGKEGRYRSEQEKQEVLAKYKEARRFYEAVAKSED
jgi:hypothetical protein